MCNFILVFIFYFQWLAEKKSPPPRIYQLKTRFKQLDVWFSSENDRNRVGLLRTYRFFSDKDWAVFLAKGRLDKKARSRF